MGNTSKSGKAGTSVFHKDQRIQLLETLPTHDIVELLVCEQIEAFRAVGKATEAIAEAARLVVERSGRLIFAGAGTSIRLGAMNAIECGPTFGTRHLFTYRAAGGDKALLDSVEGAEDSEQSAKDALSALHPDQDDVVCGIAASGSTPYVRAVLRFARLKGLATIFITGQAVPPDVADVIILLDSGPEVIHGSTRMKAGTAQKVALDALTTTINALRGRTYGGLMVDMVASNAKLSLREVHMLQRLTRLPEADARALLASAAELGCKAHRPLKIAAVMHHRGVHAIEAAHMLSSHHGSLRSIIGDINYLEETTE